MQTFMGWKKKFSLIVLYTQTFINILLFGIFAHLNIYIKSKKKYKKRADITTQRLR